MGGKIQFILIALLSLGSCHADSEKGSIDKWKHEILETEQNFAEMAKNEGIAKAFETFAADDVVLERSDSLVIGKRDLIKYFGNQDSGNNHVTLTWKPDFIDVSSSGDLGYTYGHYNLSSSDSSGHKLENRGVFHTVWKRQVDGTWRFVWD